MKSFGYIKFVGDKIYEQADSKLELDNDHIEIDGDVYKLRGSIYKNGEHTLYLINGMLFEEYKDIGNDEIRNCNVMILSLPSLHYLQMISGPCVDND